MVLLLLLHGEEFGKGPLLFLALLRIEIIKLSASFCVVDEFVYLVSQSLHFEAKKGDLFSALILWEGASLCGAGDGEVSAVCLGGGIGLCDA